MTPKTRVLIVDDSAIVRRLLSEAIADAADLEVVGTAPDPFVARDKILSLKPDVLTLDIEMPRMDGLTFLRKLMRFHPMPVVVISSLGQASSRAAVEALESGAVEVLCKPGGPYSVGALREDLPQKLRSAARARIGRRNEALPALSPPAIAAPQAAIDPRRIIALGASTGGVEALGRVLHAMPANSPGIVLVQHIPPVFSREFAARLDKTCAIRVREAVDGDAVAPGLALVAPGDFHMMLERKGAGYAVAVKGGPRVCYQRPSVDVLFESVATVARSNAVGALLTGMGADGAQGMLRMKQAGAHTIAQNEETCVVFGMPREAILLGAADEVLPLERVASALTAAASRELITKR